MAVVKILVFEASKALLDDLTLGDFYLEHVSKADGCLSVVRGYEAEAETKVHIVIRWETYEKSRKFSQQDNYPLFLAHLKSHLVLAKGRIQVHHIEFDLDPTQVFNLVPTTETATFTLKLGHTKNELNSIVADIRSELHLIIGICGPILWGEIKECPGTYVMAVGWDSVAAHIDAVKEQPLRRKVKRLFAVAHIVTTHANLMAPGSESNSIISSNRRHTIYSPL